jgi:hypothetical protein
MLNSIFGSLLTALFIVFSLVATTTVSEATPTHVVVKCKCGDACRGATCTKCDCGKKSVKKASKKCECGDACQGATCDKCDCGKKAKKSSIKKSSKRVGKEAASLDCECDGCCPVDCTDCGDCDGCTPSKKS